MEVKVTSKSVEGLTDGFTGQKLEVYMQVKPKTSPLFYCPNAFSVHLPYRSLTALQDAVSMKNGVRGLRDSVNPVCPYTGEKLRLRVYPDGKGYSYTGGLNPRRAFTSLADLVYHLSMRGGKSDIPKPGHPAAAVKPREEEKELPEQNLPSDDTLEAVEHAAVRAGLPRQTQVSMSVSRRKKGAK